MEWQEDIAWIEQLREKREISEEDFNRLLELAAKGLQQEERHKWQIARNEYNLKKLARQEIALFEILTTSKNALRTGTNRIMDMVEIAKRAEKALINTTEKRSALDKIRSL